MFYLEEIRHDTYVGDKAAFGWKYIPSDLSFPQPTIATDHRGTCEMYQLKHFWFGLIKTVAQTQG